MNHPIFTAFGNLACGCPGAAQEEVVHVHVDARSSISEPSCESEDSTSRALDEPDVLEGSGPVPTFCVFSEKLRSMTLSSRQATQNAVERVMARIRAICEESALHEEDGASINLDSLVMFVWPDAFFEDLEKSSFCKRRYHSVTTAHNRLIDTLDAEERERLVIILSLKDKVSSELRSMGFIEHNELQSGGCFESASTYQWRLRRFCESGPGCASWLNLKWSVAETGCSPGSPGLADDVSPDVKHFSVSPCAETPRGANSSRASTRDVACGASALSASTAADRQYFFRV